MSIESGKIIPPSVIIKQPSFLTKYKNYILIFISLLIVGMTVYFIYKKSTKKEKVDCQLSEWVYNNNCICDNGSSTGYKYKYQSIIKNSDNGGIACPSADSLRQKVLSCNCSSPSPSSPSTSPSPSSPTQPPSLNDLIYQSRINTYGITLDISSEGLVKLTAVDVNRKIINIDEGTITKIESNNKFVVTYSKYPTAEYIYDNDTNNIYDIKTGFPYQPPTPTVDINGAILKIVRVSQNNDSFLLFTSTNKGTAEIRDSLYNFIDEGTVINGETLNTFSVVYSNNIIKNYFFDQFQNTIKDVSAGILYKKYV